MNRLMGQETGIRGWHGVACVAMLAWFTSLASPARANDDLSRREEKAFQAAVDRVAPYVVRIETVGGRDRLGKASLAAGPTTGLVVSPDGLIVSSALGFLRRPDSILVELPDGVRKPARLLATDHSRMIVLLSIKPDAPLGMPEFAPRGELRVGHWAIAVGRTFESDRPNVSVGIASALARVRGRAIQTDAAVSPSNYGGPLVDVHGRVIGVLTPLAPSGNDELGKVEWYDSGIAFAVPAQDILQVLPRLSRGEDLYAGSLGVAFASPDPNTAEPVVAACQPNSAASKHLKPGDRITAVDGKPVRRVAELMDRLGRHYADDRVELSVERDKKVRHETLTLDRGLPPTAITPKNLKSSKALNP
jgi:serine protease Do